MQFSEGHVRLGVAALDYDKFLRLLVHRPERLAEMIHRVRAWRSIITYTHVSLQLGRSSADNAAEFQQSMLRVCVLNLWNNCWQPEEDVLLVRFMQALLTTQLAITKMATDSFSRRNSLFSRHVMRGAL